MIMLIVANRRSKSPEHTIYNTIKSRDNGSCTNNTKSKCKSKGINLSTVSLASNYKIYETKISDFSYLMTFYTLYL